MIAAHSLAKHYGKTVAVSDLSFEVTPGVVTGFLGPNGSGKSTTMRMIMGLDTPTAGAALVNGTPYTNSVGPCVRWAHCLTPRPSILFGAPATTFSFSPRRTTFPVGASTRYWTSSGSHPWPMTGPVSTRSAWASA